VESAPAYGPLLVIASDVRTRARAIACVRRLARVCIRRPLQIAVTSGDDSDGDGDGATATTEAAAAATLDDETIK